MTAPILIRVDTREQTPLTFDPARAVTLRGTVPVFDYALDGDEEDFAVERKSLADFVGSLITPEAFERECNKLLRARRVGMSPIVYVVEGRWSDLFRESTYARFKSPSVGPGLMQQRWRHLQFVERVSVIFACDAKHAAHAVYGLLKIRSEYLKENG
jgi:ERCC4-type nuclease